MRSEKPAADIVAGRWWWGWSQLPLYLLATFTIRFFRPLPFLAPRTIGKSSWSCFLFLISLCKRQLLTSSISNTVSKTCHPTPTPRERGMNKSRVQEGRRNE